MSSAQFVAHQTQLSSAAEQGTLTEQMLQKAVDLVVDYREYLPESVGFHWIRLNMDLFRAIVPDPYRFMLAQLGSYYFSELAILYLDFLLLVPEGERSTYIREVIMRHGALNNAWVKAATAAGIPRSEVRRIIIDRLKATEVRPGGANFVSDFVKYGLGQVSGGYANYRLEENTPWSVMTDAELVEALLVCAQKSPEEVLGNEHQVRLRLDPTLAEQVSSAAVDHLLFPCCPDILARQPAEKLFALARRMKTIPEYERSQALASKFIIGLVLRPEGGRKFYREMSPILDQIGASTLYRHTWNLINEANRDGRFGWLVRDLRERLAEAGYVIGIVSVGSYTDRRTGRNRIQLQVTHGDRIYVQERSHRYSPQKGDEVIYKPASGRNLTPRVIAVSFYPARRGDDS